jgi:hypothetical protein
MIAAPAAWGVQLQLCYALVPHICLAGSSVSFYLVTGACALVALACGVISYREWRSAGRGSPDATDGGTVARSRFLGALGVLTSATAAVTIVAQGLAIAFLHPCWT